MLLHRSPEDLGGRRGRRKAAHSAWKSELSPFQTQKDISHAACLLIPVWIFWNEGLIQTAEYRFLVGFDCRYVSSRSSGIVVTKNTLFLQTGNGGKDDANWLKVGILHYRFESYLKIKTFRRMYRLYWNRISLSFTFYLGNKKKTASRSCWKEADGGNVW